MDEFEDKKLSQWAGTSKTQGGSILDHKQGYIRDHHKSQFCGSVSSSAPFGTNDNGEKKLVSNLSRIGSKVAPFGTDNNDFLKNVPKYDHRNYGNSNNQEQGRGYKKIDETNSQPISNVL